MAKCAARQLWREQQLCRFPHLLAARPRHGRRHHRQHPRSNARTVGGESRSIPELGVDNAASERRKPLPAGLQVHVSGILRHQERSCLRRENDHRFLANSFLRLPYRANHLPGRDRHPCAATLSVAGCQYPTLERPAVRARPHGQALRFHDDATPPPACD